MDMKINFLPAKTWNWLRMNETEVKAGKKQTDRLWKKEIPGNVCGRSKHTGTDQNRYGTGHGQGWQSSRALQQKLTGCLQA